MNMSRDLTVETVLFDVGGTMLRVHPSVGEVYCQAAAAHGFAVEGGRIETGFRQAWKRSVERSQGREYRSSDAILRQEWFEVVRDTFGEAIPASSIRAVFDDLYERFVSRAAWTLIPGIRATLRYLRGEGVRLGVLSNWDSRLRPMLRDLGFEGEFDFIVVSHEVGYEKPHPAIFQEALRHSGTDPSRTLHVGDSYEADIAPARSLRMRTLWVAPSTERKRVSGTGPGVDALPEEPLPFWSDLLRSEERE